MTKLLLLFLVLPMCAFSGRNYDITFTVIDDATENPLENARISIGESGDEQFVTDASGFAFLEECKKESVLIIVSTEGYYEQRYFLYNRKKKSDQDLTFRMISKNGPNISRAKLDEMEKTRAFYDEMFSETLKQREMQIAKVDTNAIGTCFEGAEFVEEISFDPEFPGGQAAMQRYIVNTVEYPEYAIENDEQGTVYLSFDIEKNGAITNIEVIRGVSESIDTEAIRVIYGMPKWVPAFCNGRTVKTNYKIPINYTLN